MSQHGIRAEAKANGVIRSVGNDLLLPPGEAHVHTDLAVIWIPDCPDMHTFHGCPGLKLLFNLNEIHYTAVECPSISADAPVLFWNWNLSGYQLPAGNFAARTERKKGHFNST